MLQVIFNYKGAETIIKSQTEETIEEVIKIFKTKIGTEINNEYYLYNGNMINKNNKLEEIINNEDKANNKMKILVKDTNGTNDENNLEEIKEIICPQCQENVIINLKDYKIGMKCINDHNNKILLKDFKNKIDISKIKCQKCSMSKNEIHNNALYICLNCNINLCPLCKLSHDKEHNIINYDNKNYICHLHNESYDKYCCNKNICIYCGNEHKNHDSIYYGDILPDINDDIKKYIDKLKNEIEDIINLFKNVMDNIDIYYKIYNNIIDSYNKKKKNYEILQNINEFNKYNKTIIKDINEIN